MKDLYFNKWADLIITNTNPHSNVDFTLKTIGRDNPGKLLAVDFFKWDYNLDRYRYPEHELKDYLDNLLSGYVKFHYADDYGNFIREMLSKGINKCVGMDFSLWYDQPPPTLIYNLYLNMSRLRQAQDMGMQTIFNWNNAMVEWEPIFEEILPPSVPIVMVDSNHLMTVDQTRRELAALEMFTKLTKVDTFIIQAGRKDVGEKKDSAGHTIPDMQPFLDRLKEKGIRYFFVPGQTSLLNGVRTKQDYLEEIGIESVACDSKKCLECSESRCKFRGNNYYPKART
jgi:hypothetical protein